MTRIQSSVSQRGVLVIAAVVVIGLFGTLGFFGIRMVLDRQGLGTVSVQEGHHESTRHSGKNEPYTKARTRSPSAPGNHSRSGADGHRSNGRKSDGHDPHAKTDGDGHYVNARFGFSVELPRGWNMSEAMNSDGVTLSKSDLVGSATAYGTNEWPLACTEQRITSVSGCANAQSQKLGDEGFDITYSKTRDNWFVLSGSDSSGQGIYLRWYLGTGSANALVVDFPMSEREEFDQITTDLSLSMSPGDLSVPH